MFSLAAYNKELKRASKVYTRILRETGSHAKAFQAENEIVAKAQRKYELSRRAKAGT